MKNRVVLTLILVSCFAYLSNAQLLSDLYKVYTPVSQANSISDSTIFSQYGIIKPGKPVYNISFGAGYSSFGKGMGFSNTSITPTIAFAPNDKFLVFAGASFSHNNFNNMPTSKSSAVNGNIQQTEGNPTQAFAYGLYQINNRFSVYAMGSFAKNQLYASPFQAGIGKVDYQQLGFGFNYKLSTRASLGASFNFTNAPFDFGLSPSGFNPFGPMFP